MKKLFFMFAAIVAVTFSSCGNKTSNDTVNDSVDTVVVDSVADSTVVTL